MASSVFYKFSSRKDESRVTFDGTGISVFDLKRDIILANNMGKSNDFDLSVFDATSKQEYKDDSQIIPPRPGKGKASMYVAGASNAPPSSEPARSGSSGGATTWHRGAMSKRFDGKEEPALINKPLAVKSAITKDDEAAAMAAMFQAQTANWEETQEKMSQLVATRIYNAPRGTGFARGGKPHTPHQAQQQQQQHDRPLPPSYRTTGIPRSMLKAVENPNSGELGQGVMVTPEGGYVVAQPDLASWQKQVRERTPTDTTLACPIDNKLFRDAVKTPCCGKSYCEDCIQTHLLERDFICPNCTKKVASLDKLIMDKPARTKVADYIEKAIEESKKVGDDEPATSNTTSQAATTLEMVNQEQDFYSDQQPGIGMDMPQMLLDSIPQLQAQIAQISLMLQNPSLPNQVRHTTEMQHQQLHMQLQQAQTMVATLAAATGFQQQQQQQQQQQIQNAANGGMGYGAQGYQQQGTWNNQFSNQQPAGQDSAYQRLPLNNRRRNLKRDRPSDFLEIGGEEKIARYWE
ncbi:DWNN domain-containing protein [Infundibulicybe gibba]|nr:DWNN domain-containing protein [Infundibulicybe gibba]